MRAIPSLALGLLLTSKAAATDAPPIHRFTLENGLKVVVEPSPRSERAFVLVRYDVGSRDDPAGYQGLAHLTEHLSFRRNEVLTDYDDLGATSTNGITSPDHTYYSAHVPVAAVEQALSIEGERMAFLLSDLTERDLAHEQRIVTHEWKQRTHNVVSLSNVLAKLVFPDGHPYRLLADDPDDVAAIRLPHVQWFAQAAYRPERATLVVTGGVDAERVHAWAAPVEARELARAKLHARERIAIALESGAGTYDLLARILVEEKTPPADLRESLEHELARIDAVRAEDVQRVARTYLSPRMRGVSVAGPLVDYAPVLEEWCGGDYDIFVPKRWVHEF